MNLANVDAAVKHVRQGIIGCELLRLPVVRVQLRWMEATLAEWYGDFAQARRQYEDGQADPSANGVVHGWQRRSGVQHSGMGARVRWQNLIPVSWNLIRGPSPSTPPEASARPLPKASRSG